VPVCLSVCLSVTGWCSAEMAKHRIMQTMPHDTQGLYFSDVKDLGKTNGVTITELPNASGVG